MELHGTTWNYLWDGALALVDGRSSSRDIDPKSLSALDPLPFYLI